MYNNYITLPQKKMCTSNFKKHTENEKRTGKTVEKFSTNYI